MTVRADSPSWVSDALRALPVLNLSEPAAEETPPPGYAQPHPAVCRIVVPEPDGTTYGSGTLVDVRGEYGLVVTNWHVVETARQELWVEFADGFRSAGKLLKVDRDWDLAAIAIWRPQGEPVALASVAPRPGDELVIAGFGNGPFRAARGQCLQYVTPSLDLPLEMVQVTAAARNGDSGGPIFNAHGELAGVLFGTGEGVTSGSYCGRVNEFLASVLPKESPRAPTTTAARGDLFSSSRAADAANAAGDRDAATAPQTPDATWHAPPATVQDFGLSDAPHAAQTTESPDAPKAELISSETSAEDPVPAQTPQLESTSTPPAAIRAAPEHNPASTPAGSEVDWLALAGDSAAERVKTALAILGLCTLIWHTVRLLAGTRAAPAQAQG